MQALQAMLRQLDNVATQAGRPVPRLLAVSKRQPATAVAKLAAALCEETTIKHHRAPPPVCAIGENYVQEAKDKQAQLHAVSPTVKLEWHLIGHLQSNKAKQAAAVFDWVQTVDRPKLIYALAGHRTQAQEPLHVLVQVNIDDESSKHGCRPDEVASLAAAIAAQPRLVLRGLMAIPAPYPDLARRRNAFRAMRALFDSLGERYPGVDTLSMGMSEDYAIAVAEGATMVRIGTALFGARPEQESTA